jgi:hypothetical protein
LGKAASQPPLHALQVCELRALLEVVALRLLCRSEEGSAGDETAYREIICNGIFVYFRGNFFGNY